MAGRKRTSIAGTVAVIMGLSVTTPVQAEPALIKAVAPEYPRAAERRDIEGYVVVSIDVDADGKVAQVSVIESDHPGIFDSAATRAVERWRFEAGQPTNGILKKVRFKLEG